MCLSIAVNNPDHVLARGEHLGFAWIVTHNGIGRRCGYVRVLPGHPWHGKDYEDVDADVHGGLTFAKADVECDRDGPDDGWWLGFDCDHYGDAPDPTLPTYSPFRPKSGEVVRTQEYVEAQCRELCRQAAEARP